jgi:hypothetical protein
MYLNLSWLVEVIQISIKILDFHFKRLISVDAETGKITNLDKNLGKMESCNILKFENDWICAVIQSYTRRPSLVNLKIKF